MFSYQTPIILLNYTEFSLNEKCPYELNDKIFNEITIINHNNILNFYKKRNKDISVLNWKEKKNSKNSEILRILLDMNITPYLKPKLSVIVPIYKVEKYIKKCINSLKEQTFKEIEIILIDDGTPDYSGKYADKAAISDNRIITIHTKNAGVSCARNIGIEISKGKYFNYLDSDDYLHPYACEYLYKYASKDNVDLLIFGLREFLDERDDFNKNDIDLRDGHVKKFVKSPIFSSHGAINFFKTSIVKKYGLKYYSPFKYGEDTAFCCLFAGAAKTVKIIRGKFYQYRIRKDQKNSFRNKYDNYNNGYVMKYIPEYVIYSWRKRNWIKNRESLLLEVLMKGILRNWIFKRYLKDYKYILRWLKPYAQRKFLIRCSKYTRKKVYLFLKKSKANIIRNNVYFF